MLGLIPKPWLIVALIAVFVGSNAFTGVRSYRLGNDASEARHAEIEAQERAAADLRTKELKRSAETVAQEVYDEQIALEARARAAGDALARLHEALAAAKQAARDASPATGTDDAATVRQLFGECASHYRDVAEDADQLRARVLGLQAYVRQVCLK